MLTASGTGDSSGIRQDPEPTLIFHRRALGRTTEVVSSELGGLPVSFVGYRTDGRRVARGTPVQGQFFQRDVEIK